MAIALEAESTPVQPGPHNLLHLSQFEAALFDLDGVLADTAKLHQKAWEVTFNDFLSQRTLTSGEVRRFSADDYYQLIDGRSRIAGVEAFLNSRHLSLPAGAEGEEEGFESMAALAAYKNKQYLMLLAEKGARPIETSIAFAAKLKEAGLLLGVVSSSRNATNVLSALGILDMFDVVVDGNTAALMQLNSKPSPDTYQEAAKRLGVPVGRTLIIEDAMAGVAAGRKGKFGLVVGLDRRGEGESLRRSGADLVLSNLDLLPLEVTVRGAWRASLLDSRVSGNIPTERQETLGALGNGYLGTRAAMPWVKTGEGNYHGSYLSGVYNQLITMVEGQEVLREALVNIPNWTLFSLSMEQGPWLDDSNMIISDHLLQLDLYHGLLLRRFKVTDPQGRRCAVGIKQFISMAQAHLAGQEITVVAENWSGQLQLRVGIDADVRNCQTVEGKILDGRHLTAIAMGEEGKGSFWLTSKTINSNITIAQGMTCFASTPGPVAQQTYHDSYAIEKLFTLSIAEGGRITVEKVVATFNSRDRAITTPLMAAMELLQKGEDFGKLCQEHEEAWVRLWGRFRLQADITSLEEGRVTELQLWRKESWNSLGAIHLQIFHLLQVASIQVLDLDIGIPPRGLTGEGYLGHVFWDEMFVLPSLILRFPEIARALLRYRIRRLPAARDLARKLGHQGAAFPWQSASSGADITPLTLYNPRSRHWMADLSNRQRHVGLAIAYELWYYWQTTGDTSFFFQEGAEVFLEIARFFASLATYDTNIERWRIKGVMGPDEFHDGYAEDVIPNGIDDNAYTNVFTVWLLKNSLQLVKELYTDRHYDVLERIGISDLELQHWQELTTTLYIPFHDGVISQFSGYEKLRPLDLQAYREHYKNIERMDLILESEGDQVRRYQVTKQADTLMLFYLFSAVELRAIFKDLGYQLTPALIRDTIEYYTARACHGSTLSAVVHGWVAARVDRYTSFEQFCRILTTDIADVNHGTTAEGVHMGAMAGTIDLLQRGYTGLEVRGGALWLNPILPDEIERLRFPLVYHGRLMEIDVDHRRIVVSSASGQNAQAHLVLFGEHLSLRPGERVTREMEQ